MDSKLSIKEKAALTFHLAICKGCKVAAHNYLSFRDIFMTTPIRENSQLSPKAYERILQKIKSQINNPK